VTARRATSFIRPLKPHRPFVTARGADIALDFVEDVAPTPDGPAAFDSGGGWTVHRHEDGWLYRFESPLVRPPCYEAIAVSPRSGRGTLYFPRPEAGPRPSSALLHVDEMLFQHHFARAGAFEVHACGVVAGGRALVFCGQSGAGKTTTALLWKRHRRDTPILSDDRIVLAFRGARVWAHGTPWHGIGRFALPLARPLGAIFFLQQADESRVERLGAAAAVAQLFARGFPPVWDRPAVERALATCDRVVSTMPCYRLLFRRDRSAVEAALAAAGAGD
jgi:hypothetical protein